VRRKAISSFVPSFKRFILIICVLFITTAGVRAQSTPSDAQPSPTATQPGPSVAQPAPVVPSPSTDADAVRKRMERARALAAAHQLTSAATEFELIRASVKDEVVRNLASVMLMGIYLEDGNYMRAESLLEETFKDRSSRNDASVRTYFALAGQAVNGARLHLGRYRSFGINVSNTGLPSEAAGDLDRLRSLLERMVAQAKELTKADPKGYDVLALLEDVAGIRASLARDNEDRQRWENEYALAREKLASSKLQIASLDGIPGMPVGQASPVASPVDSNTQSISDATGSTPVTKSRVTETVQETAEASSSPRPPAKAAAPTASGEQKILEVGSLTDKGTSKIVPSYPQIAKSAGVSGLVRVKVVVDERGSVASIAWIEGPMLLRQAAQDAARQWKFPPTIVDGRPVRVAGYIDFAFSR
jgi:TonB family protein